MTQTLTDDTDVIIPANDDAIRAVADHSQIGRRYHRRSPQERAQAEVEAEFASEAQADSIEEIVEVVEDNA